MIATVIDFHADQSSVLVVVIEKENLNRMRAGDPITLEAASKGGMVISRAKYPANMSILIAYEEDDVTLWQLARLGDTLALVRYLERGRKWDPNTDGQANIFHFHKAKR